MFAKFTRRRIGLAILYASAAIAIGAMPALAEGKKIAIMPKTLINDVFQIKIAESAEAAAAKLGIETERFGSSSDVAVEDQINIIEAVISLGSGLTTRT